MTYRNVHLLIDSECKEKERTENEKNVMCRLCYAYGVFACGL